MAITCDFASSCGEPIKGAYVRVATFRGTKSELSFSATVYDADPRSGSANTVENVALLVEWNLSDSLFSVMYAALKAMPQASNAIDA